MRIRALLSAAAIAALVAFAAPAETPPLEGFRLAKPGWVFEFPRDHGAHDEFRTEWWYFTGHLRSSTGHRYGFEVTFFRVGAGKAPAVSGEGATNWDLRNVALAHFALTDVEAREFRYYEKLNRSTPFLADAKPGLLHVFNEGWSVTTAADGAWRLVARGGGDMIDVTLRAEKAPAIHGRDGVSVKAAGEGHASHYYSMTRLTAEGTVATKDRREKVRGQAWMDHEFGSATLREHQAGWDWFSLQFDNETELMLYIIRRRDGAPDETSSGSIVLADGAVIHLERSDFSVEARGRWKSRASGATYPMGWRVRVPKFGIELDLREVMKAQELVTKNSTQVTYWEGAVDVTGRSGGTLVRGEGYVEMTGYDRPFSDPAAGSR
ncbi:MAG: carotenoid 1,2-hydratase [Thermoanaerobaculia bacterium]|nr:carotenoid 1,2-hydratase [Thermoanaerobaculia bacterium]